MVFRQLLLIGCLAAVAACGQEAAPPSASGTVAAPRGADLEPEEEPAVVFDTVAFEPPSPPVEIPVRPPDPLPDPPPPPPTSAPGSCDVRETESFCFAYTGSGWTDADARDQCSEAPDSQYRPGACPAVGQIATCLFRRPSDPTLEIVYTYYAPYDVGLAEVACPGEFTRLQ